MMIKGMHGMFYSSQAEELRVFFRDVLEIPCSDVGHGWLIFDLPEAEIGVHPTDHDENPPSGTPDISFYCDNIQSTVKKLRSRGVEFIGEVEDHGYGLVTFFLAPGGLKIQLYQPRYKKSTVQLKLKSKKLQAKKAKVKETPKPQKKAKAGTKKKVQKKTKKKILKNLKKTKKSGSAKKIK